MAKRGSRIMREIVISGKSFEYRVGRLHVLIRDGKTSYTPFCHDVVGLTPDAFERGQWKRTQNGMVTPFYVGCWIKNNVGV